MAVGICFLLFCGRSFISHLVIRHPDEDRDPIAAVLAAEATVIGTMNQRDVEFQAAPAEIPSSRRKPGPNAFAYAFAFDVGPCGAAKGGRIRPARQRG